MTGEGILHRARGRPLKGQHAVVTGASRGIGAAIAEALAHLGADLTLMSRNEAALRQHAEKLAGVHEVGAQGIGMDVGDPERISSAFARAGAVLGPVHILVNNAGIAEAAPFTKTDPTMWRRLIDVDLTGPYLCIAQVLPAMLAAGSGRIVNVASTAGLTGYPYVSAYCAAKHGLIGLTRSLAQETARKGITVNAVCPGYADTDIVGDALANIAAKTGRSRDEALAELVAHNPQGRLIKPEEVAETVGWLCLPSSAAVTGQSIVVAGGELM